MNCPALSGYPLKVAERLEAELGEEQWSFIEGCPRDWAALPIPDGPIKAEITVDKYEIGPSKNATSRSLSARVYWHLSATRKTR